MVFLLVGFSNYTYAETNKNEEKKVTRGECIMHIMKILGVDDDSASLYADIDYVRPVFADLIYNETHTGYIIIANLNHVAIGVNRGNSDINYFEANRNVTVKECIAFVLRCLTEPSNVKWDDSIISSSVEFGLLTEEEIEVISFDSQLTQNMLKTILERMSNMDRRLYWSQDRGRFCVCQGDGSVDTQAD